MKFDVPPIGERIYVISADLQSIPVVPTRRGVPFKVGISSDPHKRLRQLQTGCPFRLCMEISDLYSCGDYAAMEREIHRRLSHISIGGEWFFGDPDSAYDVASDVSNEWGEIAFKAWRASQG